MKSKLELQQELTDCEQELMDVEAQLKEAKDANEGEYYGELAGRLEDVVSHIDFLQRKIARISRFFVHDTEGNAVDSDEDGLPIGKAPGKYARMDSLTGEVHELIMEEGGYRMRLLQRLLD